MENIIKTIKRFFYIRELKMNKLYKLAKKEKWTDILVSMKEVADMKKLIDTRRDYLTKEKLSEFNKLAGHLLKEVEVKKERITTLKNYETYEIIETRLKAWIESSEKLIERLELFSKK